MTGWERLRKALFDTHYRLVEGEAASGKWIALVFIVEALQLASFAFGSHLREPIAWNHADPVKDTLYPFGISPYINSFHDGQGAWFYAALSVVSMIFILWGLVLYKSYNEKREEKIDMRLLRISARFFSGLFFLPTFGILFGFGYVLIEDNNAWSGVVTIYAGIFSMILAALFLAASAVFVLTNFDMNSESESFTAKPHARVDFLYLMVKTILTITYTCSEKHGILLGVFALTTIYLAFSFTWYVPYFNFFTAQVQCALTWLVAWVAIAACTTTLPHDDENDDATPLVVLLLGSPLVVFSSILAVRSRRQYVIDSDVKELGSPFEVEMKGRFFVQHIRTQMNLQTEANNMEGDNEVSSEDLKTVEEWFAFSAKRFPQSSMIYTLWGCFHFAYDRNHLMGQNQFSKSTDRGPKVDEIWVIARYRHFAELSLSYVSEALVNYLDYQKHLQQAQLHDKEASMQIVNFWAALMDSHPDLSKLHAVGSEINEHVRKAYTHFEALMALHNGSPQDLRSYGSFLSDIMYDKERGQMLINRAEEVEYMRSKSHGLLTTNNKVDIFDDRNAIVTISGQKSRLGEILDFNPGACRVFGYTRNEIVSKNINSIIPNPFSEFHDQFLTNYIDSGIGVVINQTRLLFAKHKTGNIFPVYLLVRQVSGDGNSASFIGVMKQIITDDEYMFIDHNGVVMYWTSGCVRLFSSLGNPTDSVPVEDVIETYQSNRDNFLGARGGHFAHTNCDVDYDMVAWVDEIEIHGVRFDIVRIRHSKVGEATISRKIDSDNALNINFLNGNEDKESVCSDVSGALDDIKEESHSLAGSSTRGGASGYLGPRSPRSPTYSEPEKKSINFLSAGAVDSASPRAGHAHGTSSRKKGGPKSVASVGGSSHNSRMTKASVNSVDMVRQLVWSKQRNMTSGGLRRLKRFFLATALIVIAAVIISYVVEDVLLSQYKTQLEDIQHSEHRRYLFRGIGYQVASLLYVNQGSLLPADEAYARTTLLEYAESLESLQTNLFSVAASTGGAQQKLNEDPSIEIVENHGGSLEYRNVNLHEVVTQWVSKARLLGETPLTEFSLSDETVYFIKENTVGEPTTALNYSSNLFEESTQGFAGNIKLAELICSVVAVGIVFLVLVFAFRPTISHVQDNKMKVLMLFLDLPRAQVKKLHASSRKRVGSMSDDGDFQNFVEDNAQAHEENEDNVFMEKPEEAVDVDVMGASAAYGGADMTRHSKAENQKRSIMLKISFLLLFCIAYFVGTYFWSVSITNQSVSAATTINWAGRRRNLALDTLYFTREAHLESNSTVRQELFATAVAGVAFTRHVHHALLYGNSELNLDATVRADAKQDELLFDNACGSFSTSGCEEFHDGLVTHGLSATLDEYNKYALHDISSFVYDATDADLHSEGIDFMTSLQRYWLNEALIESEHLYLAHVDTVISSFLNSRMWLMLGCIFLLLCLFQFFYMPLIRQLHEDSQRTRALLMIIPIEVMESVKSIRQFFNTHLINM